MEIDAELHDVSDSNPYRFKIKSSIAACKETSCYVRWISDENK